MIRVLQVIGSLNNGGSQAMIMSLYRSIDRSKIQFDFIIDREEELFFAEEITALGGKIYVLPIFNLKNTIKFLNSWEHFIKEHPEYKIIHGHVRSTAAIYLRIAKKYGLVTIAHSHSTSSGTGIKAIVKNLLQFPIRNVADYLFACSKIAGEWLYGKKACLKGNFQILKNAIDTKKFVINVNVRDWKRKEYKVEDKFVVGHVGRFYEAKNHDFLIDIFNIVYRKNENSVLILIGDGDLRLSIEKKVHDLGLSKHVIFMGVKSDIPDLLQMMDVFLFPSLYEGLPVTLVEAQAAGLPCVVSNTITDEIKVTNLVESVSLHKSAEYWAEKILEFNTDFERVNTYKQIIDAGYDINNVVNWYQAFIFSKVKYNESH